MLEARELAVEVGGRITLERGTFTIRPGDKVGLVGRNGAGKTSLLKVLAGEDQPSSGWVRLRGRLGFLTQEPRVLDAEKEAIGLQHVLSGRHLDEAAHRLEVLRRRMEDHPSEAAIARFSAAEDRFAALGGYAAESEVRQLVAGLGLGADRIELPVGVLSGGERRRVELARILFAGTDVLLLDEPTNHLDNDAKRWLMGFLRDFRGALLVVSHDLDLLDEAMTRVLHLDEGELIEYKGTYSQYLTARRADEQRRRRLAARQQAEIRRLSDLADAMRHQTAKRARTAKSIDKRVERLQARTVTPVARSERRYQVRFPPPPRPGRLVLEVEGVSQAYGGPPIFEDVTFAVERGERILVMGLNGAGKTSLLRILAGQASPKAGTARLGHGVVVGYYAQEHEGIRPRVRVLDHLLEESEAPERELRSLLGMFGLVGDVAFQDAGTLSGGEKTKLALAQLVAGRHNLLLLDEPTNNLDPPSREAVGMALAAWPGAMVVVSHDAPFVTKLAPDRVVMMPEGVEDYWSDELLDLVVLA
jgi:ATPase subunit of ABC transporter with duplicated ATPase domains